MDTKSTVIDAGVLYVDSGTIVEVRDATAARPPGFESVTPVEVGGTIFPGLIELHNHLSYNALQLWQVPMRYTNRDQWGGAANPDYRRLVSGPMQLLGPDPSLMPAVVRYVECKALVSGTTTSEGIELFSNKGARRLYRGNIRNVEQTDDPQLPEAGTRIGDVDAASAANFLSALKGKSCYILHLSEGTDAAARDHFLALRMSDHEWAISDSLAGIHCVALQPEDFDVLVAHGASMVWSPLSNLLLYGQTADVAAAKKAGLKIGIGPDWAPSGSKNLLGELKVAWLASEAAGGLFTPTELVAMATRTAAEILRWDKALGSLEIAQAMNAQIAERRALGQDFSGQAACSVGDDDLSSPGSSGDARRQIVSAFGAQGLETLTLGGDQRVLNLRQATADPAIGTIGLAEARERLENALANLKQLAEQAEQQGSPLQRMLAAPEGDVQWGLALDELEPTGVELRPRVPLPGTSTPTGPSLLTAAPAKPLSQIVGPLKLDPLTVVDDSDWLDTIAQEKNLPAGLAEGVRELY